jgi:NRE family putative nickel resistance protein-like MFS transporter
VAHFRGVPLTRWIALGALLTTMAVVPADLAPYGALVGLWAIAGVGQNWVNLPTETLIAERTPAQAQGRVYGAHFAWSHLWWGLTYPLAALLSVAVPAGTFALGGGIALAVLIVTVLTARPGRGRGAVTRSSAPGREAGRSGADVTAVAGQR